MTLSNGNGHLNGHSYGPLNIARALVDSGRAVFPLKTSDLIPTIFEGLHQIVHLPEPLRSCFMLDRSKFEDQEQMADDGLVRKDGTINPENKDKLDTKWYVHAKLGFPLLLRDCGVDMKRWGNWVEAVMEFHHRSILQLLDIAKGLDQVLPGVDFYKLMTARSAMSLHVSRFLYYEHPKEETDFMIGGEHADRDTLTFHTAENRKGLYLIDDPFGEKPQVVPYVAKPDECLLFAGAKAPVLSHLLPEKWHGVRDLDTGNTDPRCAAIFFGHTNSQMVWYLVKSRKLTQAREMLARVAATATLSPGSSVFV